MTGEKATSAGRTIGGPRLIGDKATGAGIAGMRIADRATGGRTRIKRATEDAQSTRTSCFGVR
jgi:hypothetical protein